MSLTHKSISKILKVDHATNQSFIVKVTRVNRTKGNYLSLRIHDQEDSNKAIVDEEIGHSLVEYVGKEESLRVRIIQFNTHAYGKIKVVELLSFTILHEPKQFAKLEDILQSTEIKFENFSISRTRKPSNAHTPKSKLQPSAFQIERPLLNFSNDNQDCISPQTPQLSDELDIKSFEKIEDLYDGLFGWQVLLRVIDKTFRNFVSKKGNETKMLVLEFIDRAGWTIQGVCFSYQAETHNEAMEKGKVYRVARAKLEQLPQTQQKQGKHSKLMLKFHSDSSIIQIQDIQQIPYCSNNWIRLSQLSAQTSTQQHFNIICLLLNINAQTFIPKEDRILVLQNLTVGDPITQKVMEVVNWNRQVDIDESMINKTVLLKHFRINKYKEKVNISSTFRSDIERHKYFEDFQGKWTPEQFRKDLPEDVRTLKQLSGELKTMLQGRSITSQVNVWAAVCFNMKWYYDACPNARCKKAATPDSTCQSCSFPINECVKRFTLHVELHDYTGSINVTAFEEAASVFVKHRPIEELARMNENQRKGFGEKNSFDNYRIKVTSKVENNGRVKHNIVGKPELIQPSLQSRANIRLIKDLKFEPIALELKA